ncbi:MAG: adenosylcobinamide-phosphate synthase CbiB [Pseudomonadota bacterium]
MSDTLLVALVALIVDALIGDPKALWRRVPHPVTLMGKGLMILEKGLNRGRWRTLLGAITLMLWGFFWLFITLLILRGLTYLPHSLALILETLVVMTLLAFGDLCHHINQVKDALFKAPSQDLTEGRRALSAIVGRDVSSLDKAGISRATLESAAENLSDGVIAPLFWYLLLGLPGIVIYKLINTADSMIGYRNDRFEGFGWASARIDDLVNWLPARLTGALIAFVTPHRLFPIARAVVTDAPRHTSTNAGYPEAALAAALGLALAGPRRYNGDTVDGAWMNREGRREAGPDDIAQGLIILRRVWFVCLLVLVGVLSSVS